MYRYWTRGAQRERQNLRRGVNLGQSYFSLGIYGTRTFVLNRCSRQLIRSTAYTGSRLLSLDAAAVFHRSLFRYKALGATARHNADRKKTMKKIVLLFCIMIAGCATSSGVLKAGVDSFTVTASASPGGGGGSAAKKSAYSQANQECSKQGRTVEIINEKASAPSWTDGMYTVDISFKCATT